MEMVYVKGAEIYRAAVAGAKRGYNRSTEEYAAYELMLKECYEHCLSKIGSPFDRLKYFRMTKGSWRNAFLPVQFLMEHQHIGGDEAEVHARIMVSSSDIKIIDIPLTNWKDMERNGLRI